MQKILIVGLGNPGSQYARNRHNVGFMVLDLLAQRFQTSFKESKNLKSSIATLPSAILCKPLTFMNLSGEAVKALKDFYKINMIWVVHDELDLPFGTLRFKKGGGHGGHNGLRSIEGECGQETIRVRCGIGRPSHKSEVASFVLSDFPAPPDLLVEQAANAIEYFLLERDFEKMQNRFTSTQLVSTSLAPIRSKREGENISREENGK